MSDTISLDRDQAQYVDSLVQSGRYADRRAVVQAGLDALRDRDAALEHWLPDDVVPVAAAIMADPSRAIPLDEVFDDIERCHAARGAADVRGG